MKRLLLATPLLVALIACPKDDDREQLPVDTIARDTTPVNLDSLATALPPPAPDTFTPPKLERPATPTTRYAAAPPALVEAVEREQAFSNFCYREFGLKSDPRLRGGVALLVTVGRNGVTAARVAADSWSSSTGKAVNECLNERAANAWKITPGDVPPGTYQVDLRFTGGT